MTIMKMITGVMNTGMMNVGVRATGFIIHMGTTVSIMYGGILGGGIGIGGGAVGTVTSTGISFTTDTMLSGMSTAAGGIDQDMVAGYGTNYHMDIMR